VAKPDLSTLSVKELEELRAELDQAIEVQRATEAKRIGDEIKAKAEAAGLDVKDVLAALGKTKKRSSVKAKYQHPTNMKLTWSGRGKKPKWLKELVEQGKSLDSLLIK
jgi:DNA-binding protein H-NS